MNIPDLNEKLFSRGLVSKGCSEAFERFKSKLESGAPVTYAAIGGSITEGASSSCPHLSYSALFAEWLNKKAPCKYINAGIGATSSMFGAFRAQQDMLCQSPDIITIEFAVNDSTNPDTEPSYEALVRQCVDSAAKPLVVLLFTMRKDGTNYQNQHIPVGRHYGLPMLSYRDSIYPEITEDRLVWEMISPDEVHPNDGGHAYIASMLEYFIDTVVPEEKEKTLPGYLYSDTVKYMDGQVIDAVRMDILENEGWTQYDHRHGCFGMESDQPGSRLRIRVKGGKLVIGFVKYAGDFGMAEVTVDSRKKFILDGFYEKPEIQKWAGGHTVLEMLSDTEPGSEHTIEIKLLSEKHNQSNGHQFKVGYILAGK